MLKSKPYIIVQQGQMLRDLALQLYGSLDGMQYFLADNPGLEPYALYTGQRLYYTPELVVDATVVKQYAAVGHMPNSEGAMSDAPVPEAPDLETFDVTEVDGSVTEYEVGDNPICEWTPLSVVDQDENELVAVPAFPVGGIIEVTIPPADDVIINDTEATLLYTLAAGATQVIPDQVAKNSAGTTLGTNQANQDIIVPDINVEQADGSDADIPAGVDVVCEMPEIDITSPGLGTLATITVYPPGGVFDVSLPRAYHRAHGTGQASVVFYGDDFYWHATGIHNSLNGRAVKLSDSDPFNTLHADTPNAFGNTNRYTNDVGGTVYDGSGGSTVNYCIDHFTGYGVYMTPTITWLSVDWANRLSDLISFGLNPGRPANLKEILEFIDMSHASGNASVVLPAVMVSCTTDVVDSTKAIAVTNVGRIISVDKADISMYEFLHITNHY